MQLHRIWEVAQLQLQRCLLLYVVRLEVEEDCDLMRHGLGMCVLVHEGQPIGVRAIDQ